MIFDRKNIDNDGLITFYKKLLLPRLVEEKMLILLRQGRIGKWFSGIGQEAIAVGSTMAWMPMNIFYPCTATWVYLQHAISLFRV
jgi:TPP-dependent pyruvate/acetoin dehydrogenase alpha subunit